MTNPIYDDNINMLVPYYLMYSYLYYEENESIVPDAEYDRICKTLYEKWNDIEHRHKNLIDKDTLLAGTGFQLKYHLNHMLVAHHLCSNYRVTV